MTTGRSIETILYADAPVKASHFGMLWWLPRLALTLFVVAVIALLWFSEKSEQEERHATLISDMLWLEQSLGFHLTHNEDFLGRFDAQRIHQPGVFDAHARNLVIGDPSIHQVIWLDRNDKVRHALLPSPADLPKGENQTPVPSPTMSHMARSLGHTVYSPPYQMQQGDWQFGVYVPVFLEGHHAGTVVAFYSIRRLLENAAPWWLAERYRVEIIDQFGQPIGSRSKVDADATGSGYQIPFNPPGHGLILRATPYLSPTPLAGRLISATLALLAVLILFSLWVLRRHVQQRLLAESALRTEVAFRKAMEDSVQTGLRARNLQGQITYINPAFCRMVGWSAEELIGRIPPMPYWAEEYIDETRNMHAKVMAGQAPSEGFEIKLKRRSGEIFDALIHEAPLIDSEGRHTGWMGSVVDITERVRAAELARQQEERLQASARLITMGEMASSLAHELNQPLSAISGYAAGCRNLIAAGAPSSEIDGALAKCQEQAQRAGRIIRRIYDFVRRHEPRSEACNLEVLISDLIVLIEVDTRRQNTRIVRNIAPDLPIIQADRILLGQALLNLMKNGIESMRQTAEAQRTLSVSAHLVEQQVFISIADRGCGFSVEDAARLFEPFYTTKSEGLGVGLNICRSVVEAHNGRLWFAANPEGGSIFHISLPVNAA
ncbi:MAG: PAS domain S-box protein [Rhodocyclaceae bacterium]|jgi:two-component system sensor histidine kinase DctS|nr:PAS domain S-box protein [Rhodocyclaceae bacterium]